MAVGGVTRPQERYVAPTVLRDVAFSDAVMQEEIFGPVLPIVVVDGVDAAIAAINARPKPLALYVFTRRSTVRRAFTERTSSGSMAINGVMVQLGASSLPFGGVGESGMGAYHGEHSVRLFSHERAVLRRLPGPNLIALIRPPFTAQKERWLRR